MNQMKMNNKFNQSNRVQSIRANKNKRIKQGSEQFLHYTNVTFNQRHFSIKNSSNSNGIFTFKEPVAPSSEPKQLARSETLYDDKSVFHKMMSCQDADQNIRSAQPRANEQLGSKRRGRNNFSITKLQSITHHSQEKKNFITKLRILRESRDQAKRLREETSESILKNVPSQMQLPEIPNSEIQMIADEKATQQHQIQQTLEKVEFDVSFRQKTHSLDCLGSSQRRKVNKVDLLLDDSQQKGNQKILRKFLLPKEQPYPAMNPYTKFGHLFPKKQCPKGPPRRNFPLVMAQSDENIALERMYATIFDKVNLKFGSQPFKGNEYMTELMKIETIKQKQHPGPNIYRKRKEVLKNLSEVRTIAKGLQPPIVQNEQDFQKTEKPSYAQYQSSVVYHIKPLDIENDSIYQKKIRSFLEFLLKVRLLNGFRLSLKDKLGQKYTNQRKYKVFVGKGNNRHLILALLKRRFWLEIVDKITPETEFIWTQHTISDLHKVQQTKDLSNYKLDMADSMEVRSGAKSCVGSFEELKCIKSVELKTHLSNSDASTQLNKKIKFNTVQKAKDLTSQLKKFNVKLAINPKRKYNKKFFDQKKENDRKLCLNTNRMTEISLQVGRSIDKILYSKENRSKEGKSEALNSLSQNKTLVTNHIPENYFIGSKKTLFKIMQLYYEKVKNIDPFTVLPQTYYISVNSEKRDKQMQKFLRAESQFPQKIWITKPGQCTNRGNGISLIKQSKISTSFFKDESSKNAKNMILQKYITNPLLYNGRKFDIRHFLMVSSVNGKVRAYWYQDGYVRTSSEQFNLDNLSNTFVHLTNDAIQKEGQNYGRFETANKISYPDLQRYLQSQINAKNNKKQSRQVDFKKDILDRMKEITLDILKANYLNIDRSRRQNNFEIFGMDFMVDRKFNVWLIEVNSNPCLEVNCPLLSRIVPIMVEHSLRLGLDPLLMPNTHFPPNKRCFLSDNMLGKLKYEILFDEQQLSCQEQGVLVSFSKEVCLLNQKEIKESESIEAEVEEEFENEGREIDPNEIIEL